MANDRLRTAMLEHGVNAVELAESVGVDPKSVERWISGRTPYRRHRYAVAAKLGVDEAYPWPDALTRDQVANAGRPSHPGICPANDTLWRGETCGCLPDGAPWQ
jgi:transcriptional regulator with XRE-family HTH domain